MRSTIIDSEKRGSNAFDGRLRQREAVSDLRSEGLLEKALSTKRTRSWAYVSSFGATSIVLLHMIARLRPETPVIFVDTKRHFAETLRYRDDITTRLGLSDVRVVGPETADEECLDPTRTLYERDPDACCGFRKEIPLEKALRAFSGWITGRRRADHAGRMGLPLVEKASCRIKLNPLAGWSDADVARYVDRHDLPEHPLVAAGYPSIGCEPCTTPVKNAEHVRSGRWRGSEKRECGIHRYF